MLKLVNEKMILLGVDAENIKRLKADCPIMVKGDSIGIDKNIVIAYGETLEDLAKELGLAMPKAKGGDGEPVFGYDIESGVLVIRDYYSSKSPTMTVTNGIEFVLNKVRSLLKEKNQEMPKRAIYQDSEGKWEGIHHVDGEFYSFIFIEAKTKKEAVHAIKQVREQDLIKLSN